MKKVYRAAIVGCGRIASLFSQDKRRRGIVTHAQAFLKHPKTRLVAACDLDASRLEAFGARWNVRALYRDFETLLLTERPDIVSICTWSQTHAALVETAVRHGVKAVICEKPVAHSLEAADRLIRVCERADVPLIINHSRRFNPMHQRLGRLVRSGALGRIQAVSATYISGLMNTGTHLFDLLHYFFGDVASVWADPKRVIAGADPTPDLHLEFRDGFGCAVHALDVKRYMQFEMDVYGTKGRFRLTDTGLKAENWSVAPHPIFSEYRTLVKGPTLRTDFGKNLYGLIDHTVRLLEKKTRPISSGRDGRKALEVAFAAMKSLKEKRRVTLPIAPRGAPKSPAVP